MVKTWPGQPQEGRTDGELLDERPVTPKSLTLCDLMSYLTAAPFQLSFKCVKNGES